MISEYDCLIVPIMTEKSMKAPEGVYSFKVLAEADKADVKRAVEKVFNVKVDRVNILNRSGKIKHFRGRRGCTDPVKIAMVRLAKGDSINYEGGI